MGSTTHQGGPVRALRRAVGLLTVALLSALSLVALAQPASAAVDKGNGHHVPPQKFAGSGNEEEWLGSYTVDGEQVFCVQFQYKAPDSGEEYEPGDELLTKWGEKLSDDVAANISYLLLRYGDTKSDDEAAALAHLLHSWTAAPREGKDDLNPEKGFQEIGYNVDLHLNGLPASAQAAVERLRADAEANRGPWTAEITAPEGEQVIGTPAEWTISVTNSAGSGVPDVPIALALTDATLLESEDGAAEKTVTTGEDGTVTVQLVPTGENPKLVGTLSAPADRPYVRFPVNRSDVQRVVSTGGEKTMTAEATTKARTKPAVVQVTKKDAKTGEGIAGVALRLTAADKTSPALGQDGEPLVGADGTPAIVTTDDSGTATIENLRTPQEVCIVEVSAPAGYDQSFDPANPPSACGELTPGKTLALQLANAPNEVPRTIPAGAQPTVLTSTAGTSGPSTGALAGIGGLALLGTALVGWTARRRFTRQ